MLLEVVNLSTRFRTPVGHVRAVDGVSFSMDRGESLGLVGESGCGKTTLIKSLIRVLPQSGEITAGQILFKGRDLRSLTEAEMSRVRWREISMITQSAMNALDPVYTSGRQIVETLRRHTRTSRQAAWRRAAELFTLVGLEHKRLTDYPHQLSGGMRQRVVIAMGLALNPDLTIADEPTTALDVVVQDGILKQMELIWEQLGNSLILVTHDVSVVAEMCQRIAVMYAGALAEIGPAEGIFRQPRHPYTMGLLNAFPTLESAKTELISIPGSPPEQMGESLGCQFAPRCPFADERCREEKPEPLESENAHLAACHYVDRAESYRAQARDMAAWLQVASRFGDEVWKPRRAEAGSTGAASCDLSEPPSFEVEGLRRLFPLRQGILASLFRDDRRAVHAVDGVSISLRRGEILGLAGESGSGKSTMGEVVAGLQPVTEGTLLFQGRPVELKGRKGRAYRRQVQMVFQDPYETLNPRFTIRQTILEPLRNMKIGSPSQWNGMVLDALRRAELAPPEMYLNRHPYELSGGQRQRVAIARAVVVEPELLIADEPVSMLDVSVRAGILNLLRRFRADLSMSVLYISHDLATIRYICDRTAILYLGRVAEIGPTESVIGNPKHPYTQLLLSAVPLVDPTASRKRVDPRGDIPDPIDLPNGCRFHARCESAMSHCGWEGRDLAKMIAARGLFQAGFVQRRGRRQSRADGMARLSPAGTDLVVNVGRGGSAEAVKAQLRDLMAEGNKAMLDAVKAMTTSGGSVRVAFPRVPEPPPFSVGDCHEAACHLWAPAE